MGWAGKRASGSGRSGRSTRVQISRPTINQSLAYLASDRSHFQNEILLGLLLRDASRIRHAVSPDPDDRTQPGPPGFLHVSLRKTERDPSYHYQFSKSCTFPISGYFVNREVEAFCPTSGRKNHHSFQIISFCRFCRRRVIPICPSPIQSPHPIRQTST